MRGTWRAIERRLLVDGLVMRYDTAATDDGLPPGEGVFLACSFWLVDAYVLQHRWGDAQPVRPAARLRNDVGLLSEEYDPHARRLVGNFPQAFTHVALVNSALNLTRQALGEAARQQGRSNWPRRRGRSGDFRMKRRCDVGRRAHQRRPGVCGQGGEEMLPTSRYRCRK